MDTSIPYTLVVFDTETTGVDPTVDEVCQFACIAIKSTHPENIVEFESLCDPGRHIPEEAIAKHGIPNEAVVGKPKTRNLLNEVMAELFEFAAGTQLILGGHNTKFDWNFLQKHVFIPDDTLSLCTLRMARVLAPNSDNHQLEHLYRNHYSLQSPRTKTAHDALCDVWMSYELLNHWLSQRPDLSILEIADELKLPMKLETMPFGKNKGRPFSEIPYKALRWYVDQGSAMDQDVRFTAGVWCKLWETPAEMMARG